MGFIKTQELGKYLAFSTTPPSYSCALHYLTMLKKKVELFAYFYNYCASVNHSETPALQISTGILRQCFCYGIDGLNQEFLWLQVFHYYTAEFILIF